MFGREEDDKTHNLMPIEKIRVNIIVMWTQIVISMIKTTTTEDTVILLNHSWFSCSSRSKVDGDKESSVDQDQIGDNVEHRLTKEVILECGTSLVH